MLSATSFYGVFKPEYFFRPQQIIRKFYRELSGRKREMKIADLPWGLKLYVNTGESIGWSIYTRALYETPIVEALWRLTQPGDLVVDGGACRIHDKRIGHSRWQDAEGFELRATPGDFLPT